MKFSHLFTSVINRLRHARLCCVFLSIKAPMLLVSLPLFFGILFAFHSFLSVIAFLVYVSFIPKQWVFPTTLLFLMPLPWLQHTYKFPQAPHTGEGIFSVKEISYSPGKGWGCQGTLRTFLANKHLVAKNVPASFFMTTPPPKEITWNIEGVLSPSKPPYYQLKKVQITHLKNKGFLKPIREKGKKRIGQYIDTYYQEHLTAPFLKALFLGEKKDPRLTFLLTRSGLSHLAAISGFHFALLAFFLYSFLSLLFDYKTKACALLILLTLYFLFIGPTPSIQRAWLFAFFALIATLFDREIHTLNLLGSSLFFSLVLNPLSCLSVGFYLTFSATTAILLYQPTLQQLMQRIFPKKTWGEIKKLSPFQQLSYIAQQFFSSLLCLNLSLYTIMMGALLYFFHQFPLISMILNLFYPTFAAGSLFLFLIGFLATPLPFLAFAIHSCNNWLTTNYLVVLEKIPLRSWNVGVGDFPAYLFFLYTLLWAFIGVQLATKKDLKRVQLWYQ